MNLITQVPPTISPYLKKEQYRKKEYTFEEYIDGILNGNRTILSKAITLIESENPKDMELASEIIKFCLKNQRDSFRIGITGIPGVGKSTFIEAFGLELIQQGHKVAVLAVDPSSEKSGGSILGDKTRMEELSRNPNAYIRPSPSRGTLGGVAKKTRETILLCETAGFDRIIVETVGVGQGEVVVHSMVDVFLLLILPGTGDELQGIKRGIMEMADGILITKVDGENIQKSKIAKADLQRALHYFPPSEIGWTPPVILTSSRTKLGFEEIHKMLHEYERLIKTTIHPESKRSYFEQKRNIQSLYWFDQSFFEKVKRSVIEKIQDEYEALKTQILKNEITPFEAAEKLVKKYLSLSF
ncbi:MAG: methylmalonyl Co-A mutase-associated GTPase MeaB [Leptospiraceae bacterium]|nr:methylmalonyl Co-A mutase-associated GTPase MeaB [Leptospiraceae bacterium]MDW7976381.1 methylmalonyl Co-A mutase-associated GTPase MeaB [Leptospiraceae bacterium]